MSKLPLEDHPLYGLAVREAQRINKVGGIGRNEPPVDVNILAIAIARMAQELQMSYESLQQMRDRQVVNMFEKYPDLTKYNRQKVTDLFALLSHYAPSLAEQPLVAGTWVARMYTYGEILPENIKVLAETQYAIDQLKHLK